MRISDWSSDVCSSDLAAGAGEAVAVDLVQVGRHLDVREILGESAEVLPVDRAASPLQQSGARQQVAAGAQRPHGGALPRRPAQKAEDPLIDRKSTRLNSSH